MGFLSILKKALPHFADAEKIIGAAKKDGAKGAAVEVVRVLLGKTSGASVSQDAVIALAAAVDDHQGDIEELKERITSLEKELKVLRGKTK